MARRCLVVMFVVGSLTVGHVMRAQTPATEHKADVLTIVVRDLADDTPLPAVSVSVVGEQSSTVLASGLTDADGRCRLSVDLARAVAVMYERVGYVRRPETIALERGSTTKEQRGRLLKSDGTRAYYEQAGRSIEAYARQRATEPGAAEWIVALELERADSLPPGTRETIESALTADVRSGVAKNRELLAMGKKTPGNSYAAYSRYPIFTDSDAWLGVPGDARQRALLASYFSQIQRLYDWDSEQYRAAFEAARLAAESPRAVGIAGRCVTAIGYCPMITALRPGMSCVCSTPAGPQPGIAVER